MALKCFVFWYTGGEENEKEKKREKRGWCL
jgi:hypothetical protein